MFDSLSDRLERSFKILKGEGRITEINVAETLKEIRRALLDADVNYKIAKSFTDNVKQQALGQKILTSVKPSQMMVKIVHEELTSLMGGSHVDINMKGNPVVILIAGLQGSGKTTFSAKLASHLKQKRGKNPMLIAGDVYRPAAIEQLRILGQQVDVPLYTEENNNDPVKIAQAGIREAKRLGYDLVIVDTAGRLAIDAAMMDEIASIKKNIAPQEILFVVDAMTGQDAVNIAKSFNERLGVDGVILTKMDGDARGGAALSVKTVTQKPIKFIGVGEKLDALEVFHPDRMVSRILGMGDVLTLIEKAEEVFDEEKAKELEKKIRKDSFTLEDFRDQLQQVRKMGSLESILGMIPGLSSKMKGAAGGLDFDEKELSRVEAIINSMTPKERTNSLIINGSRRLRIAHGSGTSVQEVNQLLKRYAQARKMMKRFTQMEKRGFGRSRMPFFS